MIEVGQIRWRRKSEKGLMKTVASDVETGYVFPAGFHYAVQSLVQVLHIKVPQDATAARAIDVLLHVVNEAEYVGNTTHLLQVGAAHAA